MTDKEFYIEYIKRNAEGLAGAQTVEEIKKWAKRFDNNDTYY